MNQATFLSTLQADVLKRLPLNRVGRDFVIGDIHGAFDVVYEALALARFDPDADRLLCVGDLIDRGPQSSHCVAFLAQPCVHAVRGNHEQVLMNLYAHGEPDAGVLFSTLDHFGAGWWFDLSSTEQLAVLAALRQLPVALEVETTAGTMAVLHGNVPRGMSWSNFTSDLARARWSTVLAALEGRDRLKAQDRSGVAGIERLFVGHTTVPAGPCILGNVWAIDTGAVIAQQQGRPLYAATLLEMTASELDLEAARQAGQERRARVIERCAPEALLPEEHRVAMRA